MKEVSNLGEEGSPELPHSLSTKKENFISVVCIYILPYINSKTITENPPLICNVGANTELVEFRLFVIVFSRRCPRAKANSIIMLTFVSDTLQCNLRI